VQDVNDEVDYFFCLEGSNPLVLDSLCKLVDSHQHMSKPS
jgi:hypothetical protein